MRWTEQFYKPVFQQHGDFQLQEHGKLSNQPSRSPALQKLLESDVMHVTHTYAVKLMQTTASANTSLVAMHKQ